VAILLPVKNLKNPFNAQWNPDTYLKCKAKEYHFLTIDQYMKDNLTPVLNIV